MLPLPNSRSTRFVGTQAVGVIGLSAYLSYLIGDYMGLSGIVALFCCAVAISHYTMKNISRQFRTVVKSVFETLSYLAEGSIFVYVGLDALDPAKWAVRSLLRSLGLLYVLYISSLWRNYALLTWRRAPLWIPDPAVPRVLPPILLHMILKLLQPRTRGKTGRYQAI